MHEFSLSSLESNHIFNLEVEKLSIYLYRASFYSSLGLAGVINWSYALSIYSYVGLADPTLPTSPVKNLYKVLISVFYLFRFVSISFKASLSSSVLNPSTGLIWLFKQVSINVLHS